MYAVYEFRQGEAVWYQIVPSWMTLPKGMFLFHRQLHVTAARALARWLELTVGGLSHVQALSLMQKEGV